MTSPVGMERCSQGLKAGHSLSGGVMTEYGSQTVCVTVDGQYRISQVVNMDDERSEQMFGLL